MILVTVLVTVWNFRRNLNNYGMVVFTRECEEIHIRWGVLVPRGGQEPLNLYEPNLGLKNSIEPFLKLTSD